MSDVKPTLGRIVHYRSRTGKYSMAAVVAATQADLHRPNVEAGNVPALDSDMHLHLVCFTPGIPGAGNPLPVREDFAEGEPGAPGYDFPLSSPASGTIQEWNVPYANPPEPGTWRWPPRSDG